MAETTADSGRRRIKTLEVMVAEVIQETPDTVTLVLFTGNDRLEYKPGHFLTLDPHQYPALAGFIAYLEDVKGKREPPRAYSLTSSPHERHIAITIKEERYVSGGTRYPPLLSPALVRSTFPGMRMVITGFTGPYTLPDDVEARTDHVVHLVAGSGSVPNFAMLKYSLVHHAKLRHTFLYSNKTYEDICFRRLLDAMAREHPARLRVVHNLTREADDRHFGPGILRGRLSESVLRENIADPSAALFYVCGPAITPWERRAALERGTAATPRFLEGSIALLHRLGVGEKQIKRESYG